MALIKISIFFLSITTFCVSQATPLQRLFGNGTPEYHYSINARFIQFYKSQFYDFEKNFSPAEKLYYDFCLKNIEKWSLDLENDFPLGYIRFAITLDKESVRFDRFAIAPSKNKKEAWPLIQKISKERKLILPQNLNADNIFWVEWDWGHKVFSVYYFEKDELLQIIYKTPNNSKDKFSIVRFKIINNLKPIKNSSILDPFISSGLSSDQGFIWLDLKGFDFRVVNEKVREPLIRISRETTFSADTVQYEGYNKAVFFYP